MAIDIELLKKEFSQETTEKSVFWVPELNKQHLVRILPPSLREREKLFYRKVAVHYGVEKYGMVVCSKVYGETSCPICDLISEFQKVRLPEALDIAKRMMLVERYLVNVLILDTPVDSHDLYLYRKPLPWMMPKSVWISIVKAILDPDYGDITDLQTGRNIIVEKTERAGGGRFIEYMVRVKPNQSSIELSHDSIPTFDEILERMKRTYEEVRLAILGGEDVDVETYLLRRSEMVINKNSGKEGFNTNMKKDEEDDLLKRVDDLWDKKIPF